MKHPLFRAPQQSALLSYAAVAVNSVHQLAISIRSIAIAYILILLAAPLQSFAQPKETRWEVMPAPNADMVYLVKPNSDFISAGAPFKTNEYGFRDVPVAPKTAGMFRILCVGDSVTFGTGVANEETFPNVLERQLQAYAQPGIQVDVINAGVSAYNAQNIRGQMELYLPEFKPDAVVYTFVENDLDDSLSPAANAHLCAWDAKRPFEEPFFGDDYAGMWLIRRKMALGNGLFARLAGLFDNQIEVVCKLPPPMILGDHPEPKRRWARFVTELERMRGLCDANGSRFLVYSFALAAHAEPIELRVRSICKERNIPEASTLPIFHYDTYNDKHSLGHDPHCNPEGHRLMADRLLSFLAETGSLPGQYIRFDLPRNAYIDEIDMETARDLEARSLAGPELIDTEEGSGAIGLIAGVDTDGKIGRTCVLRIGGSGSEIEAQITGITGTPEQPLLLKARIEGVLVETAYQLSKERTVCSFPIPAGFTDKTVEVELFTEGPIWLPTHAQRQQGVSPMTAKLHSIRRANQQVSEN